MKNLVIILTLLLTSFSTELMAQSNKKRTYVIGDVSHTAKEAGGIISYGCTAMGGDEYAFEIGYFESPKFEGYGFIIYEGESTSSSTSYYRKGLTKRWDWDNANYSIVLDASYVARYHDFSEAKNGDSVMPSQTFICEKQK
jgi:hypothetical protein